jgi:hypothetical protein
MTKNRLFTATIVAAALCLPVASGAADVPPRAARSVHLHYPAPEAAVFYNEMTIAESVPGSYFQACGFTPGYFGLQELPDGRKVVIFSVWDPTPGDDPNVVAKRLQVELLEKAEDVVVNRFGGEGTGGQSFYDFDWQNDVTYRFVVLAKVEGPKTAFAAYFFLPDAGTWKHLVTFRTRTGGSALKDLYSFVEDFRRDTVSATQSRRAAFGNGWACRADKTCSALDKAVFTASDAGFEAKETIDAGLEEDRFYLQTGGETQMTRALNSTIARPKGAAGPPAFPFK